ncbi:sororin-B-like [Carassius carassius]|uniref:sororin-B-like n=1 Tax=Carassius carassius TaxID=217509 RepID=UPI002868BF00|nr:sororin-B-like [Carassius carassius]
MRWRVLCDSNKENVSGSSAVVKSSPAVASVLSPVLPPPSPSVSVLHREPEQVPVWPLRVRRSYSRQSLRDRSFDSPNARPAPPSSPNTPDTLFGFERLQTPEVMRTAAVGSFDLSAADDSVSETPEIDPNIPGVCLEKKTARRKHVQQMKMSELDLLATEMNAEFEEAESFELFVE